MLTNSTPTGASSPRMTKRRLLQVLLELLNEVPMRKGRLRKEHGVTHYDRNDAGKVVDVRIIVDPRNSPMVTITIHELLHVYMAVHHDIDRLFTESLEEAMVEALAESLTSYLHQPKNEKLLQKWLKAIERKLE